MAGSAIDDVEALKYRIRERLDAYGHLDEPVYRRDDPRFGTELAAVDLQAFIAKGVALNRPRDELPVSLARIPLFRFALLRRAFLRLFSRLFEDQRRVNTAVLDVLKMQNEICLRLGRRIVQLEGEVAQLKDQFDLSRRSDGSPRP